MKSSLFTSIFTKVFIVLGAMFFTMNLTACETTEGAGRDVERLGDNIEDAAD